MSSRRAISIWNSKPRAGRTTARAIFDPDPELDAIWTEEVRRRRQTYREGRLPARGHADIMDTYRQP